MGNVMEKAVNISNDKLNVLEFDIEITGVDETDMKVRFVIESDDMDLGFNSKKISNKTWTVEIPAMKILKGETYPYHISVIVDGYAFTGVTGNVNILNSSKIKATDIKNISMAPKKKSAKKVKPANTKRNPTPTSKPAPLNVKKTEEILNDLLPDKVVGSKTKSDLDDNILKTIEKAKKETRQKIANNKKVVAKKKEVLDNDITNIIKKAEAEVKARVSKKKKVETKEDISTIPNDDAMINEDKVNEDAAGFSAKKVAADMIKSVTGIGKKKKKAGSPLRVAKEKKKADKVKEILATESSKQEESESQTVAGGKKIIRGKSIIEVDTDKENKIKDVLKEDNENRIVTTTPINKTVH